MRKDTLHELWARLLLAYCITPQEPALRDVTTVAPLLTFFQVEVLHSAQLTPATPLWPLELICVKVSASWTIYLQPENGTPFTAKPCNDRLIVKVSDGLPHSPTIHQHLVLLSVGMASSEMDSKGFQTLSPLPPSGPQP